jgi:hypothetical protein
MGVWLAVGRSRVALLWWYPEWWENKNKKIKWLNRNEAWLSGKRKCRNQRAGEEGQKKAQCDQPGPQGGGEVNEGNERDERNERRK